MTDDKESSTEKKPQTKPPQTWSARWRLCPLFLMAVMACPVSPPTIRRWTGPWMVGQLGQF